MEIVLQTPSTYSNALLGLNHHTISVKKKIDDKFVDDAI